LATLGPTTHDRLSDIGRAWNLELQIACVLQRKRGDGHGGSMSTRLYLCLLPFRNSHRAYLQALKCLLKRTTTSPTSNIHNSIHSSIRCSIRQEGELSSIHLLLSKGDSRLTKSKCLVTATTGLHNRYWHSTTPSFPHPRRDERGSAKHMADSMA